MEVVSAYREMFEVAAWAVFLVFGTLLWLAGARLFLQSSLSRRKKIVWLLVLVVLGFGISRILPLAAIRNRCLLLIAVLPVLAIVDIKLARSNRTFSFWFRACAFELCTVFGTAALARAILGTR